MSAVRSCNKPLDTIHAAVYGIGMNNTTLTDKAPAFHQRLIRVLEQESKRSKAVTKRLEEVRKAGRERGWND
jgi:tRNA A-37 threonylcarbamoyl transferase component Bud32